MARILATFYAFGGSAGLLMCVDAEPGVRRSLLVVLCGLALTGSVVVGRWGARWPRAFFQSAVGAATSLIVGAVALAPNPVTSVAAASLITFAVVDAHFFFSSRSALVHLGLAVLGITTALVVNDVGLSTALGLDLVLVSLGTVIRQLVALASSASRDPLTGLSNRRGFDQALEELMSEASRSGQPLSAVLIDVDHFKAVNDTYGHEEGDRVLRRVAEVWQREVPGGTFLARHGGDEFSLLLPRMRGAAALELVRRVCVVDPDVSLSCGVAQYRAGDSASQLMRSADRALYDAKILGRGRAELVSESPRADGAQVPRRP